jgi:PAS domain S-box-containing protein
MPKTQYAFEAAHLHPRPCTGRVSNRMSVAPLHPDEAARLDALQSLHLLDTAPESAFDDLARIAAGVCGTPIALISLVDRERQWFKARIGLDAPETHRDQSFCAHAILGESALVVPDASEDVRFRDNPLVTGEPRIRFYAGTPLRLGDGHPLGSLCVIDRVPRRIESWQIEALEALGRQVSALLVARHQAKEQEQLVRLLAQSEAWHKTLGASAPIGIFQTDTSGRCLYVNSQWCEIFGISATDALGEGWKVGLHPEDRDSVFQEWQRTAGIGLEFDATFRTVRKDGDIRRVRSRSRPMRIESGEVAGHVGCVEDITDPERNRRQRDRFFNLALDPLCIAGQDGFLKAVNPAWSRTLGWTEAELLRRPWREWIHPDDLNATEEALGGLDPSGTAAHFENRFRCRDGSFRRFSWNASIMPEDGTLFAVVRDITEQREAEDREREALSRHRALFETASDSMLILEAEGMRAGVIVDANPAAAQQHGLLREELVGRRYRELFAEPDRRLADNRLKSMASGETVPAGVEHRRKDGSHFQLEESADRFLARGRPHILVVGRDVTARLKAEKALLRQQADLRRAQKQARLGSWHWDRASGNLEISEEVRGILRLAADVAAPACAGLQRHLTTESAPRLDEAVRQSLRHGTSFNLDLAIRRADGAAGYVTVFGEVERDGIDMIAGLVGTVQDITDRKLSENALRASEERWSFALEGAGDGVWDWDCRNGRVNYSRRWKEMLGYSEHEVGTTFEEWTRRVHPEDLAAAQQSLQLHLDGRTPVHVTEHRMRCRDGGWKWILARGMIMQRDANGEPLRVLGTHSDITQRKAIEAAARRDALLLAESQSLARVGGWEMDLETEILYWTHQTHRIFDTEPDLHIPTLEDTLNRFTPESRAAMESAVGKAVAVGGTFDLVVDVLTGGGNQIQVEVSGSVVQRDGKPVKLVGAFQDVTVRRRSEAERIRLGALSHAVVRGAAHAIVATDIDGTITVFNPAAERLTGFTAAELVGSRDPSAFHDPEEMSTRAAALGKALGRTVQPGFEVFVAGIGPEGFIESEWTYVRKDAGRVPVWLGVSRLEGPNGECIGYLGIASDLSERKRIEEHLRQAKEAAEEANRAKSEFLAMMSHEIRTPMNGVLGFVELLKTTDPSEEQASYISTIETSGGALLSLINDILDLSKIEAGRMEVERVPFDLHAIVEETARILSPRAAAKGLEIRAEYAPEATRRLIGDPARVRQVLLNLAGNAVKFTTTGHVALSVSRVDAVKLRVSVTDTGPGIPEDRLHRLFQKFSQVDSSTNRKFGGTGLGLAISKQLVELMGGRAGVESRVGTGSTFWFELPVIRPMARKPAVA